jgi:phage tail-like protein
MANAASSDPYRAYNFKLEIQGVTEGHFTECSGLEVKVQTLEYREAGTSQGVRKLPGRTEYAAVTLRYGLTRSTDLWSWFQKSVQGEVERRNVSILLLGPEGVNEVLRWNLIDAWPSGWRGMPLDAQSREVAIETLTLAFDRLERA